MVLFILLFICSYYLQTQYPCISAKSTITEDDIRDVFSTQKEPKSPLMMLLSPFRSKKKEETESGKADYQYTFENILLDEKYENLKPEPAECCNPVPGDDVVGFIDDGRIVVHRTSCKHAIEEMATHKNRIVKAKWRKGEAVSFLAAIEITAIDRHGLLQELTRVISDEMDLNIRGITLEGSKGVGRGIIMVYVSNLDNLNRLIEKIRNIDGIENVTRI